MYIVNCDGYIDFNPRSHEGSDSEDRINIYQVNISIHAPTRGATATTAQIPPPFTISIHAPTRGATVPYHVLPSAPLDFNPRSHEGSDTRWHSTLRLTLSFQSTLPRGERLVIKVLLCETTYFNPRSHEGSDSNFRQKVLFSLSKNCLKYLILTTNYFN